MSYSSRYVQEKGKYMPKATADDYTGLACKAYDIVTGQLPVFGSAKDIAGKYCSSNRTLDENIDSLIRWHSTKAAVGGFVTGLGGLITMPVAIPADIAQSFYIQLRMVGAIAHLYGHDIQSEEIKTVSIVSLCGVNQATEILKKAGIEIIGKQLLKNTTKSMTSQVIAAINKAAGLKLVSKFGSKSAINLGKAVPLVGGLVGGTFNYASTMTVGKAAKMLFKYKS